MKFKNLTFFIILTLVLGWAGVVLAQQSSITLKNSDAALCHTNNTEWTLEKTASASSINDGDTAEWTVKVTKGATSDDMLTVNGFMQVQNTGTAPATIGNIVVNLQKRQVVGKKETWVSVAADVADAASGDAATSANIVAAASQEKPNNYNYSVVNQKGTFTETTGKSGKLEFTDADSNTVWAITPQKTILPGETVNLIFSAEFNNTNIGLAEGELVRAEVIVTFGNAGSRGGSGASAPNIDINGNGSLDTDEAWVRSVPTRLTRAVPVLKACNAQVNLTDPGVSTTGTVDASDFNNDGIGDGVILTDSAEYTVSAVVAAGTEGGSVCNEALLKGEQDCTDCSVQVIIGYNPMTGEPIYYTFPCCTPVDLKASACITVNPAQAGFEKGDYCTYGITAQGWNNKNFGGKLLSEKFYEVYPPAPNSVTYPNPPGGGFVEVGIPGNGGYSMIFKAAWIKKGQQWEIKPAYDFIMDYLPDNGTPAALDADVVNPTSTSSKSLGSNVLALKLNVDFNAAGHLGNNDDFGSLKLCNFAKGNVIGGWILTDDQATALNGKTISQILEDANTALGGGGLPSYVGGSFEHLVDLLEALNGSFIDCEPGTFATQHLCK